MFDARAWPSYDGTATGATTDVGSASDWPQELVTARFMAPQGAETCVYQDFLIPSTMNAAAFHVDIATFNRRRCRSASRS